MSDRSYVTRTTRTTLRTLPPNCLNLLLHVSTVCWTHNTTLYTALCALATVCLCTPAWRLYRSLSHSHTLSALRSLSTTRPHSLRLPAPANILFFHCRVRCRSSKTLQYLYVFFSAPDPPSDRRTPRFSSPCEILSIKILGTKRLLRTS